MEKTREIRLNYSKGMTSIPSDIVCSDEELAHCLDMMMEAGEWKPWQQPAKIGEYPNGELLFVHNVNNEKHYIYNKSGLLSWSDGINETEVPNSVISGVVTGIESIGNIIVLSTTENLSYYLWKGEEYVYLGDRIPIPKVVFSMKRTASKVAYNSYAGILHYSIDDFDIWIIDRDIESGRRGMQTEYNNLVVGLYEESCKDLEDEGYFTKPFAVRYALKLYNGSYLYISSPIWMFPSVRESTYCNVTHTDSMMFVVTQGARLWVESYTDYSNWTDIVVGISVFVSKGINIYDTAKDLRLSMADGSWDDIDSSYYLDRRDGCHDTYKTGDIDHITTAGNRVTILNTLAYLGWEGWNGYEELSDVPTGHCFQSWPLDRRSEYDIINDMENTCNYYHLFDIPVEGSFSQYSLYDFNKLSIVETLPQLTEDDYFSTSVYKGAKLYSYNNRIHRYGYSRNLPAGFTQFSNWKYQNLPTGTRYDYLVLLRCVHSGVNIEKSFTFRSIDAIGDIFYYPDPSCVEASIYLKYEGDWYLFRKHVMKEHPTLHLSQSVLALPYNAGTFPSATGDPVVESSIEKEEVYERFDNILSASEADNPFVFHAEGITTFQGKILGIATITTALSEGQFGQYPLLAFTSKGIWSVAINEQGLCAASQPISREVLTGDICMVDGLIFFSSSSGLMQISGRKVTLVSSRLHRFAYLRTFIDFADYLQSCRIVYDYKNSSLLIIGIPSMIYHLPSGTFSVLHEDSYTRAIEDYPDCIIQDTSGDLYSLLSRPTRELDEVYYQGTIVSRPLKLGDGMTLKSIREIRSLHSGDGSHRLTIESSNDLLHWKEETSLLGAGKRYFRFTHTFNGMKAGSTFAGVVVKVQDRRAAHYQ